MPTKKRRTLDERIADLQAELERTKAKAAAAKARKDPALRHISNAVRAIDKAAAETKDRPLARPSPRPGQRWRPAWR